MIVYSITKLYARQWREGLFVWETLRSKGGGLPRVSPMAYTPAYGLYTSPQPSGMCVEQGQLPSARRRLGINSQSGRPFDGGWLRRPDQAVGDILTSPHSALQKAGRRCVAMFVQKTVREKSAYNIVRAFTARRARRTHSNVLRVRADVFETIDGRQTSFPARHAVRSVKHRDGHASDTAAVAGGKHHGDHYRREREWTASAVRTLCAETCRA